MRRDDVLALDLDQRYCDEGWASGTNSVERIVGLGEGYLRFAPDHPGLFRIFRFPPPGGPADGPASVAAGRVAERVISEVNRMAGALTDAIAEGTVREVDPRAAAVFLWAAWDGIIAAHLLPGNMGLSKREFESVLEIARETLILGLLGRRGGQA